MKLVMLSALSLVLFVSQAQNSGSGATDLAVLKFNCGTYQEASNVIRPIQDPDPPMNEPIRIAQPPPKNETQEIKNRRELNERTVELRGAEIIAAHSAERRTKLYFYHLEIRNTGTRKIKSFAWEYQSTGVPDVSDRQFFCVVNAKPNDKKEFDLFTPLAPSRVLDATSAGQTKEKRADQKARIIINKVEYADGTNWVRPGWNAATFSAEATHKVENGKCVGL